MKTLMRCGFVTLIILGLAIQVTHGQHGHVDSDATATLAAGMERLRLQTSRSAGDDLLMGHTPSCEQPIRVVLLGVDGAEDERLRGLRQADEVVRYAYLGRVEDNRDEIEMIIRSVWASTLFTVGLRSARPPLDYVAIMLPRACPGLAHLDWAVLSPWD